jgi:hypothetical protein
MPVEFDNKARSSLRLHANFDNKFETLFVVEMWTFYMKSIVYTFEFLLGLKIQYFFFNFALKFGQEIKFTSLTSTPKTKCLRENSNFAALLKWSHDCKSAIPIGRNGFLWKLAEFQWINCHINIINTCHWLKILNAYWTISNSQRRNSNNKNPIWRRKLSCKNINKRGRI